jgi:hypothetical protein
VETNNSEPPGTSIPPRITKEEALGFSLYLAKAVLTGRAMKVSILPGGTYFGKREGSNATK